MCRAPMYRGLEVPYVAIHGGRDVFASGSCSSGAAAHEPYAHTSSIMYNALFVFNGIGRFDS